MDPNSAAPDDTAATGTDTDAAPSHTSASDSVPDDTSTAAATTDTAPSHTSALAAGTDRAIPTRGYTASKDRLLKRLRRIEGQVRGVERMVEEDRYCIDVLTQISAVQAALDKVALGLMDEHARHCVLGASPDDQPEKTEELMSAIARLMRRG